MSNKDVRRGIVLYIDGKEVKNSVTSIKAELRKLTKELDGMTVGSKEYQEQMKKIANLNQILRKHKQELAGVNEEIKKGPGLVDRFNKAFSKFGTIIASTFAAITGFTLALKSFRDERNKLEESQANLKALTGLDDASINWLTKQAKILSTTMTKEGLRVRQSAQEILNAFMMVGSAKPELLSNKEALAAVTEEAMRLQTAAGDIKLDQAVNALTQALNQYGAGADQAAKFTNVLAAGSKAGAANIASQASAILKCGTAASTANVSIEQTVSLIETLAYKGIKDEVAGTGLKKFFLVLQTGAKETNPAIVGLDKALQNLKDKNLSASEIKKMFGEEGFNVASIIMSNIDMVKQFQQAVTDSSVAMEQAAINSDTAAAKLAQAKNKLKLSFAELGEKLDGVYTVSTNLATYLVKVLPVLIDWFKEWGTTVVFITGPFLVYAAAVKSLAIYHATLNTATKIATTLKILYAAAVANATGNLSGCYKIMTLFGGSLIKNNVLLKACTTSTYLFAAAKFALTGNLKAARAAMIAFSTACNTNVYAIIASAVIALSIAIYKLSGRTKEYYDIRKTNEKISQQAEQSAAKENERIGTLTTKLRDNTRSLGERRRALEELKKIIPGYNADLTDEGRIINENTEALEKYNRTIAVNAELKEVAAQLDEHRKNMWKQERIVDIYKGDNSIGGIANLKAAEARLEKEKKIVEELQQRYTDLVKQKTLIMNKPLSSPSVDTPLATNSPSGEDETDRKKRINAELERIETEHLQKQTHLQKLYLSGQLESEQEYAALLIDLERQTLDQKLAIAGMEPHDREKLQVQLLEAQIKWQKECEALEEKEQKKREIDAKKASDTRMTELNNEYKAKIQQATLYHYNNMTSEQDFRDSLRSLNQGYYNAVLSDEAISEEEKTRIKQQQADDEIAISKEKYDKEKEMSERYTELAANLASDYAEAIGDMIANGELSMRNFLKETLLMALDALEKIVEMTCIEVMLKNVAATAPLSWIGAAKAAIQVAAIKAAFAVVKGLVSNFYTGGYTAQGEWDEPQGIVHSNEFVANRFAVANPAVRPVLDLINNAQLNGSVSNIRPEDIAAVVPASSQSAAVITASSNNSRDDRQLIAALSDMRKVVDRLNKRLNDPIEAYSVISGRGGTAERLRQYEQLLKNKSRS